MEREPLGFPPSFAPRDYSQRTSGRGQAIEHEPETRFYGISRTSKFAGLLDTCDLVSHSWMQQSRTGAQWCYDAPAVATCETRNAAVYGAGARGCVASGVLSRSMGCRW
jgi:hypothetical protein